MSRWVYKTVSRRRSDLNEKHPAWPRDERPNHVWVSLREQRWILLLPVLYIERSSSILTQAQDNTIIKLLCTCSYLLCVLQHASRRERTSHFLHSAYKHSSRLGDREHAGKLTKSWLLSHWVSLYGSKHLYTIKLLLYRLLITGRRIQYEDAYMYVHLDFFMHDREKSKNRDLRADHGRKRLRR